jgi:hypothetical protein
VRENVLFLWFQGISRDEIAKIIRIGTGSVSEIMKVYRTNDSDIDLEREYVVNVKKQGYHIDQLEPAIRLNKHLGKLHLSQDQIESFLDELDEYYFKRGVEAEEFIRNVVDVCSLSRKTRTPVEELPSRIKDMKEEISSSNMEIISKKVEREKALHMYSITEWQLREFAMNRPVIEKLQTTERNLAIVTAQRNAANMEICRLRVGDPFDKYAAILSEANEAS